MIKAVLFDFGGVLTEGGTSGCVQRIFGSIYGIDPTHINKDSDLMLDARTGLITERDYFDQMNRRHPEGARATRDNYLATADIFVKSEPVYTLAIHLRKRGIATGILSNIIDTAGDELRRRGFYEGFEPVILSYQEHLAKPDPAIYKIAIERLGVAPNEILLIDDQEKCRPPAEALGMHFIVATSPQQIVADTKALIAEQNGVEI